MLQDARQCAGGALSEMDEVETKTNETLVNEFGDQKRVTFSSDIQEEFPPNSVCNQCILNNVQLEHGILPRIGSNLSRPMLDTRNLSRRDTGSLQSDSPNSTSDINTIAFSLEAKANKFSIYRILDNFRECFRRQQKREEKASKVKIERKIDWGSGVLYDDFLAQVIQPLPLLKCAKHALKKLKMKDPFSPRELEYNSFNEIFEPENVFNWNSFEVCAWLKLIGLDQYTENFLIHGVNGSTLLELSRSHFKLGLEVNDEDHLTSLQVGITNLLFPRKNGNRKVNSFFHDWNMNSTVEWLKIRGFSILEDRFREKAIHGGMLLFVDIDYLIEKVISLHTITISTVVKLSLKASILRERQLESYFQKPLFKKRKTSVYFDNEIYSWSLKEVEAWLRSVNVGHKILNFKQHCVNGTILLSLDYDMMREMGLSEIMSFVLIKALNHLRRERFQSSRRKLSNIFQDKQENAKLLDEMKTHKEHFKLKLELIRQTIVRSSDDEDLLTNLEANTAAA